MLTGITFHVAQPIHAHRITALRIGADRAGISAVSRIGVGVAGIVAAEVITDRTCLSTFIVDTGGRTTGRRRADLAIHSAEVWIVVVTAGQCAGISAKMHTFRTVGATGVVDAGRLTVQRHFALDAIRSAGVGIGVRLAQLVLAFGTLVITAQAGDHAVALEATGQAVGNGLAHRAFVAAVTDIGVPITVAVCALMEPAFTDLRAFFVHTESQTVVGNETVRAGLSAVVDIIDSIAIAVVAGVESFVAGGLAFTAEAG